MKIINQFHHGKYQYITFLNMHIFDNNPILVNIIIVIIIIGVYQTQNLKYFQKYHLNQFKRMSNFINSKIVHYFSITLIITDL